VGDRFEVDGGADVAGGEVLSIWGDDGGNVYRFYTLASSECERLCGAGKTECHLNVDEFDAWTPYSTTLVTCDRYECVPRR
jgi:hypothetical protein